MVSKTKQKAEAVKSKAPPAKKEKPAEIFEPKKADSDDEWGNINKKEPAPAKTMPAKVETKAEQKADTKPQASRQPEPTKIDFFGHQDDDGKIDIDQIAMDFKNDVKQDNPFGKSITKEVLQQSKKEIHADKDVAPAAVAPKRNLAIEIDETDDYKTQNERAQQTLNDQLMKMEE